MNIVFMGTPDFALAPLLALHKAGYKVLAVYTQPDRPYGRGKKIKSPPVKDLALSLNIPVFQRDSMKDPEVYKHLKELKPDFFVVVAYGHILPESLLEIPTFGAINIHASLLPEYRGAAPIQWAIARGEKKTGVSTMLMDAGMDTGDILLQEEIEIGRKDTALDMHDKLSKLGADLIVKTLKGMEKKEIKARSQDNEKASYAPLLKKKDGRIPWHLSSLAIDAHIRGMNPWPGAFTQLDDMNFKIFDVEILNIKVEDKAGSVLESPPLTLIVATGDGALMIKSLQSPSGKKMSASDFLKGKEIPPGSIFI